MMELNELCQHIIDGDKLQQKLHEGGTQDITAKQAMQLYCNSLSEFIMKAPTLKPVDMSVLKDSGIDCEFWAGEMDRDNLGLPLIDNPAIGALTGISGNQYWRFSRAYFNNCRPRQDYWHSALNINGDLSSVIDDLIAAGFDVVRSGCGLNIIFNSDHPVLDGRCLPWEAV